MTLTGSSAMALPIPFGDGSLPITKAAAAAKVVRFIGAILVGRAALLYGVLPYHDLMNPVLAGRQGAI